MFRNPIVPDLAPIFYLLRVPVHLVRVPVHAGYGATCPMCYGDQERVARPERAGCHPHLGIAYQPTRQLHLVRPEQREHVLDRWVTGGMAHWAAVATRPYHRSSAAHARSSSTRRWSRDHTTCISRWGLCNRRERSPSGVGCLQAAYTRCEIALRQVRNRRTGLRTRCLSQCAGVGIR